MGALDQYEDMYDQSYNGGALSASTSPMSQAEDPNDVSARKDIFNQATQRLLQARQQMQAPYQGHDLGAEAFASGLTGSGANVSDIISKAFGAQTAAEQKQREANQAYQQQLSGMDTQAQLAKILGSGGSIQDATALAGITGNDKLADTLIKQQTIEQGKYLPIKDSFGNVTGVLNTKTGTMINPNAAAAMMGNGKPVPAEPSSDPQVAAQQILDDAGTPMTPMMTRQDVTGRNAQASAYRNAANAAKSTKQQLDILDAQTGKYTPGSMMGKIYGAESAIDMGGEGATARTEADKASKALANSFMQQNVGAKGSGIRMVEFDAGAVPNANMTDEARSNLIKVNKSIADSQIQRAAISDMYPRMHISNVNAIMDAYESANPPVLPTGEPNSKWMTYKNWLAAGRPNTAQMALTTKDDNASINSKTDTNPQILSAPPAVEQRIKGQTYPTPKGNMIWTGDHWTPAGDQ